MSPDYFELLGLTAQFDIDLKALETAYFKAQRQYHPDRFIGSPAPDRQVALLRSGEINNAYQALKNPLARAQYLLHLQGIAVGTETDSVKPSPSLLEETMQWREDIEAAQDGRAIATLGNTIETMITQSQDSISRAFSGKSWQPMAQETLRLGYLIKAREALGLRRLRVEKQAL